MECLNEKCKFLVDPANIQWKCMICKEEFKSEVKMYNQLDFKGIKNAIKETIINRIKAKPEKIPCCPQLNDRIDISNFYHKKECSGELYLGELDNKDIVVCERCRTMNFYDKYIWTCPICLKRFKQKESAISLRNSLANISIEEDNSPTKDLKRKFSQVKIYEKTEQSAAFTIRSIDLSENFWN